MGGIVKRSLAMVLFGCGETIAKACGLDDATRQPARSVTLFRTMPKIKPRRFGFMRPSERKEVNEESKTHMASGSDYDGRCRGGGSRDRTSSDPRHHHR
jgi:hypothetical protein